MDGVSKGVRSSYTFANVTDKHTIKATFKLKTYTITTSAGANGSISPVGPETVNHGVDQAFDIVVDPGFIIEDVKINGLSIGAVERYFFKSVTTNQSISADFTVDPDLLPVVTTSGAGSVTMTSATLHGVVNPNAEDTTYYFEYGKDTNFDNKTPPVFEESGSDDISVYVNISGLEKDTTYRYRLVASHETGSNYGEHKSFRTPKYQRPKAIIVAGGGPHDGNLLWDATRDCANFAYHALMRQGYTNDSIYYLTADTGLDLDGNGGLDDLDGDATIQNLEETIERWAKDAEDLFIYMTDHGGPGTFRMNENEILNAADLDILLDGFQETTSCPVTLLYDACQSGSFLELMLPPPGKRRILATTTTADQPAVFADKGSLSFSFLFWARMSLGESFYNAYVNAKNGMMLFTEQGSYLRQEAQIDANGNGVPNEDEDKDLAKEIHIGVESMLANDMPTIWRVSPRQILNGETSALIYAEKVISADGIDRVWAIITPPGFSGGLANTPITNLPTLELDHLGANGYAAIYDDFTIEGVYNIAILAKSGGATGVVSLPKTTTITQKPRPIRLDIKANSSDDPITVNPGTPVSISIGLEAGSKGGRNADWWILESAPGQMVRHFDLNRKSFVPGIGVTYQSALLDLNHTKILEMDDLPLGEHIFYFWVDMDMDGVPGPEQIYHDKVTVRVIGGQ